MPNHVTPSGRTLYSGLLDALTGVMGVSTGYLGSHGPRVATLARRLARSLYMDETEVARVTLAGVLADVGMIGLAEGAWPTPAGQPDEETRAQIRLHPERSAATVGGIPHLESLARIVRHHHEWWDGSGYPNGLRGQDIPRAARVLRVADTVVAMASERPGRAPIAAEEIRRVVDAYRGVEFDPEVAEAWLDLTADAALGEFETHAFERYVKRAAEELIPEHVSPLSSDQLLEILSAVIDAKDPYTAGHSRRVAVFSVAVANQLGLDTHMKGTLWAAGYLHDLGKLAIPVEVLAHPGSLSLEDHRLIRSHTSRGAEILSSIPSLRHLRTGARYHHERWDGTGYPEGLAGNNIPLVPRILAIADAYDAMTTSRAYRSGRAHSDAMQEVRDQSGRHFCPDVAEAFLSLPTAFFEAITSPSEWQREPAADPLRRATGTAWRYL